MMTITRVILTLLLLVLAGGLIGMIAFEGYTMNLVVAVVLVMVVFWLLVLIWK
jgi:hypothetical protein